MPTVGRHARLGAAVAFGYGLGSQLAFSWFGADGTGASFFPAAGVTLGALLLVRDRSMQLTVLAAAGLAELCVDLWHDIALAETLGYVVANLVQPVVGAAAVRAFQPGTLSLGRTRVLFAFVAGGVVCGPAVGGILGAITNELLGDGADGVRFMFEWWVGDGLGALVVGSLLLALATRTEQPPARHRRLEGALLVATCVASAAVVAARGTFGLVFAPIAALMAVAGRAGWRSVTVASAGVAFAIGAQVSNGNSFWAGTDIDPRQGLLYMQLTVGTLVVTALALAAEIEQRELAAMEHAHAESARRDQATAAARADRLRRLSDDLSVAMSAAEVSDSLARHGADCSADVSQLEWGKLPADGLQGDPIFDESARRSARHALERIERHEAERRARSRAELLEAIAERLAHARSHIEIASSIVADLMTLGCREVVVWVHRAVPVVLAHSPTENGRLLAPGASGAPPEHCWSREATASVVLGSSGSATSSINVYFPARAPTGEVMAVIDVVASASLVDDELKDLLAAVAHQCGTALDRATLHADLAAAADEAALLAELSGALEAATTVDGRATVVAELLSQRWDAQVTVMVDQQAFGVPGHVVEAPTVNPEAEKIDPVLVLPLRTRGRTIGSLRVRARHEPFAVSNHLVEAIATRVGLALDNALLYERERDASHALQAGLLGGPLPSASTVRLAGMYRAGTESLEVGGDWYDAFWLPSGCLGIVVGDVVGHSLQSAITMGQLRSAARALAPMCEPGALLERLDEVVGGIPGADASTMMFGNFDPVTGVLRYAVVGHMPPIVAHRLDGVRALWQGRSPPLGFSGKTHRSEGTELLRTDDVLLCYTDGLVERRDEHIEVGMQRLIDVADTLVRSTSDSSLDDLLALVIDGVLVSENQHDDACALALRAQPSGPSFRHAVDAHPAALAPCRHALRDWLATLDLPSSTSEKVLLAVDEAIVNSVEHAYGAQTGGVVVVDAAVDRENRLWVAVRDRGNRLDPHHRPNRGQRTSMVDNLADDVRTDRQPDGTLVQMTFDIR